MLYSNDSHSSEAIVVICPGEQYMNHTWCLTFSKRVNEAGVRHNQEPEGGSYIIKCVFQKCHSKSLFCFVSRGPFLFYFIFLNFFSFLILERGKLAVKMLHDRFKNIKLFHIPFHIDQTVTSLNWIGDLPFESLFPTQDKVRISACTNICTPPAHVHKATAHWGLAHAFVLAKMTFG